MRAVGRGIVCGAWRRDQSSKRMRSTTVRPTRFAAREPAGARGRRARRGSPRSRPEPSPAIRWPVANRSTVVVDRPRPGRQVVVVCQRVEMAAPVRAEDRHERRLLESRDVGDRVDAAVVQLRRGLDADSPQPLDRQRVEEVRGIAIGFDHEQPVGLRNAARDLARNLVRATPTVIGSPTSRATRARSCVAISNGAAGEAVGGLRRRERPRRRRSLRPEVSCR